ncbi:hypothetical protein LPTSP4_32400 [Leptospira ryugenii]|uniref:Lcl C-terminal domain-containing protein n=1 Tax=Leptospira ryugenii TaxID=1917863 RepID=A0A2P2E4A8_9LEPT|nr:DUF1566 domain-containing protein [Leptospira ryugenii]GBF51702.1 hypothetical protein LPTSP4_32400 [Leptospira ryugenii]
MKYLIRSLTSIISPSTAVLICLVFSLVNCQERPVKQVFPGLTDEEASIVFTGILLNTGFTDNRDGTVTDNIAGLIWRKCSQGQVYRIANNDCQGIERVTATNPILNIGSDTIRWGATPLAYCSIATQACNTLNVPQVLIGSSPLVISGESEAFRSCNALNDANGAPGWRVPNPIELQRLTLGGRNAMLALFPQTQEEYYWTNLSRAEDVIGQTAATVIFEQVRFGEIEYRTKTDRYYVRCVRPR